MKIFTKEQIDTAFYSIPDDVQRELFSTDTERKVQKVGMEAGLLIDQLKTLNGVANFAIMGLIAEKDLEAEFKNSFGISDAQSKEIAEKVSTEILKPINELKIKVLAEEKLKMDRERLAALEEENERRVEAEEAGALPSEYSSEASIEISQPENLPTKKDADSSFIKLTPKVPTTDGVPVPPFEEKMQKVFTGASAETGSTPSIPPASLTGNLHHDPYREAVE